MSVWAASLSSAFGYSPKYSTYPPNRSVKATARLIEAFGFRLSRVSGSHHIFVHPDLAELLNLQEVDGKAKPYQIRQFLRLIERYNVRMEDDS